MTDKRFTAVKSMIQQGQIKKLDDIVEIVPKTVLSAAIRMNPKTLSRKMENVGLFTIDEVKTISEVFNVDFLVMIKLIAGVDK